MQTAIDTRQNQPSKTNALEQRAQGNQSHLTYNFMQEGQRQNMELVLQTKAACMATAYSIYCNRASHKEEWCSVSHTAGQYRDNGRPHQIQEQMQVVVPRSAMHADQFAKSAHTYTK